MLCHSRRSSSGLADHYLAICDPISRDAPYARYPEDAWIECDTPFLAKTLCCDKGFFLGGGAIRGYSSDSRDNRLWLHLSRNRGPISLDH